MNKTTRIAARISEELKDILDAYCKDNDIKVSEVIRIALEDKFNIKRIEGYLPKDSN